MCFVFCAGTTKPMLFKEWRSDAPELSVKPLTERESPITAHFSKPEVQYIGSTSACGCDFPHVMFQNGEWPWFEDENEDEVDRQRKATEQLNREGLVTLLRQTCESSVESYTEFGMETLGHHQRLTKKSTWRQYSIPLSGCLHFVVNGDLSVRQGHRIAHEVKKHPANFA